MVLPLQLPVELWGHVEAGTVLHQLGSPIRMGSLSPQAMLLLSSDFSLPPLLYQPGSIGEPLMSNRPLFWELSQEEAEYQLQESAGRPQSPRTLPQERMMSGDGPARLGAGKRWRLVRLGPWEAV